jgi:hypothetical protein
MMTPIKGEFVLTPAYAKLLTALEQLHIATAEQLCHLYYSPNSIQLVKAMMKTLVDEGYARSGKIPTVQGRQPYYYFLTNKGFRSLPNHDTTKRTNTQIGNSFYFIDHALGLGDVIISAMLLQEFNPDYRLASFIHEHELKRKPYKATWQRKNLVLIPDAFLDLRCPSPSGKKQRIPVILEFDCNTERQSAFRQKIRAYSMFIKSGAYREYFGVQNSIVAFTTFAGEKRRNTMREWAKLELAGDKSLYNSFLFASLVQPPEPSVWLESCWYTPEDSPPLSLLAR